MREQLRNLVGYDVSPNFLKLMFAVFLAACSGDCSSSCGGCGGLENRPYPADRYDETVQLSGQIRVTPTGFGFLEQNITPLVTAASPGGLNFCLPEDNGNPQICYDNNVCADGSPGCQLSLTIDDAKIKRTPPDTLDVEVTIGGLDEELSVRFLASDCLIKLQDPANSNLPGKITATLPVKFQVDPQSPTGDVRINLGELGFNIDQLKLVIRGRDFLDNVVCVGAGAAANISQVRDLIIGQLEPTLQQTVDDVVREQLCQPCDANGACGAAATCAADGICEFGDGTCMPRVLGLEGRLLLGAALADYTEHPEAGLDMMVKVADRAQVNDGLTLGLRSGFQPDEIRRCVPADPTARPDYMPIQPDPAIVGNLKPNGQPFMFGLGYHKKAIEHFLWSMWGSGATCLIVRGADISQVSLTGSLFTALLPSLKTIVPGDASVYLKIVPQTAPKVVLGANTVTPNGTSYTIDEPLMTLDWKDLDIHFYAFSQERWLRLFTLRGDVAVPIALVVDGMGQLVPVIGDLGNAITNIRPVGAELSSDDPQRMADLLPTLIGAALPSLTGSLVDPIALPDLLGLQIQIGQGDITSVSNNTMIAIYANLGVAPQTQGVTLESMIARSTVDYSKTTPSGLVMPSVQLQAAALRSDGQLQHPDPVEWSYRVNEGFWSMWSSAAPVVNDPVLMLPGKHQVELRARYQGAPDSKGASVSHEVSIDWDVPALELERSDNLMRATVSDLVDTEVDVRFRLIGEGLDGAWTEWSAAQTLDLTGRSLPELVRVDVEARDDAGHVSTDTQTVRRAALTGPAPQPAAGCSTAGDATVPALALFMFAAFMVRRRRTRGAFVLAALVSVAGCSCDDEETATQTECEPACAAGTFCDNGECKIGCDSDDDCVSNETCEANQCEPKFTCPAGEYAECPEGGECQCLAYCGGGCAEGEYCCQTDNACQTLPDPCEKQVCQPGFQPNVVTPSSGVAETCEATVGTCECAPLPPLDPGFSGAYLDIDQNAGVTAISAYNSTYGDLIVGVVEGTTPTLFYADGVPATGDIEGDLEGPRGGIKDRGPNVGSHTAIVVDGSGTLHAFYRNNDTDSMWYARGTGSGTNWTFEKREFDATKQSGFYADAALVGNEVHVIYLVDNLGMSPDFRSTLRHARFDVTGAVNTLNVATGDVLDGVSGNPCGQKCAAGQQCLPAVAACVAPTNDCAACDEGSACYNGSCQPTWTAPAANYRLTTGVLNELTTTSTGLLATFWDGANNQVVNMQYNSSTDTWGEPLLTPGGPYATGVIDGNGKLHIAYMDVDANTLIYENVTDGVTEVIIEGVRDSVDGWMINDIGEDVQLRVEADGSLVATFQDATRHTLHVARRGGAGWTISELAGRNPYTGSHGFFATMLRAPDTALIAHFTIHQQLMPATGSIQVVTP